MYTRVIPLDLVESIAAELAEEAQRSHVHLNGFSMPGIPSAIMADEKPVRILLTHFARRALAEVEHTANPEYESEAMSAGCNRFLSKPAGKAVLEKVLLGFLKKAS